MLTNLSLPIRGLRSHPNRPVVLDAGLAAVLAVLSVLDVWRLIGPTGAVRPLAGGIELSAYRIIQETLTNTMKHAGPGATAVVGVNYTATELTIEITDDGGRRAPRDGSRQPAATDA